MRRSLLALMLVALSMPASGAAEPAAECARAGGGTPPLVSGPCSGIRPGARMVSPAGCTMNFVFRGATDQDVYIGTAAHCIGSVGQGVWLSGEGFIGTVSYNGFDHVNTELDFALVKVAASKLSRVDPALCHWGGPVGVLEPSSWPLAGIVRHYGHGMITGSHTETKARSGVMKGWGEQTISFLGTATWGDSGSPLMTADGLAAGAIVAIAYNGDRATRIDVAMARASQTMGVPLTLLTAPLA